jgi:chromosome segregation ATPase
VAWQCTEHASERDTLVSSLRQCRHAIAAAGVARDQSTEAAQSAGGRVSQLQRQLHEAKLAESSTRQTLRENVAELTRKLRDEAAERVSAEKSVARLTAELRIAQAAVRPAAESAEALRSAFAKLQSDLIGRDRNAAELEQQRDAARADALASSDQLARLAATLRQARAHTTAEATGSAAELRELHERLAESQVALDRCELASTGH